MATYSGKLQIVGDDAGEVAVLVDLTGDQVKVSVGSEEVAKWPRNDLGISAMPDGFHIRAPGEAVILDVDEPARFANELRLRHAHPALRKKMAALLRSDPQD